MTLSDLSLTRQVKILNYNRSKISKHLKKATKSVKMFEASLKKAPPNEIFNSLQTEYQTSSNTLSGQLSYYKNLDLTTSVNLVSSSSESLPDDSYTCFSTGSCSCNSKSSNIYNELELFDATKIVEPNENAQMVNISSQSVPSIPLGSQLSEWAVNHNITHIAINDLLKMLKPYHSELPNDARTLLHTPRSSFLKDINPGKYYHFGLELCLKKLLKGVSVQSLLLPIEILINI